jgi:hypothetical protein
LALEGSQQENGKVMSRVTKDDSDEMKPEYDLRGGVRGRFYEQYCEGTNVVLLEADVAKVFRDSEAVNKALRVYISEHGSSLTKAKR